MTIFGWLWQSITILFHHSMGFIPFHPSFQPPAAYHFLWNVYLYFINNFKLSDHFYHTVISWPYHWSWVVNTLFTYIVWRKGYFHPFPLTVGILSPLNLHYHVVNLVCSWITCLILCISNRLTTAISLFNISPDLLGSYSFKFNWYCWFVHLHSHYFLTFR